MNGETLSFENMAESFEAQIEEFGKSELANL